MNEKQEWRQVKNDKEFLELLVDKAHEEHQDWAEDASMIKIGDSRIMLYFLPVFMDIIYDFDAENNTFLDDWMKVSKYNPVLEKMALINFMDVYKIFAKVVRKFLGHKEFDLITEVCDMFLFDTDAYNPIVKDMRVFFNEWRKRPENQSIVDMAFENTKRKLRVEVSD